MHGIRKAFQCYIGLDDSLHSKAAASVRPCTLGNDGCKQSNNATAALLNRSKSSCQAVSLATNPTVSVYSKLTG